MLNNRMPPPPGYVPPRVEAPDTGLDPDEVEFILNQTLKPKHRHDPQVLRFIGSYLRCRNGAQSAREAGYASGSGAQIRNRPDIHAAIEKLTERAVMKYGFDASELVERVKEISNVDPLDFCNPDGSYKRLADIPPEARRAIKKIKAFNKFETDPNGMRIIVGEIIEIELWDKMKAHEMLGREKSLFKETKKVEHDVTGNMRSVLLASQERAEARLQSAPAPLEITAREVTPSE